MKNAIPLIWRRIPERYALMGTVCENCKTEYFPKRMFCAKCRRKGRVVEKQMPDEGKIFSFSEVHVAPTGHESEAPYFLAIIELKNGVRLMSQIVDSEKEKIKFGSPVKMMFRKITEDDHDGTIAYGYKFKVV
ncbi:Zn-ribbon domain-containing OB-fold protein [Candidatus Micrarchaeota archaeon]|nr:Zn-ribbon domain-containing OB-fold protein [Candidatus Micrarchaeota archaeon]